MLKRLAGMVLRRRRAVLVAALVLALIGGAAAATLFEKTKGGGFDDPGAESGRAATALRDVFGQGRPNLVLLVTAPGGVDARDAAGAALGRRLAAEPGVANVTSYWNSGHAPQLRGAKGDKALVLATISGDDTAVDKRVARLAERYAGARDGLEVKVGGYAMLQHEMNRQSQKDAATGEMIVFPVTLVALVFVFGSVVAALLPLAVAFVTMLLGMGLMWVLASVTDLSVLAVNAVTLLGLGLAIDYSLLIVNRYREELGRGRAPGEAIRTTMTSAGRTVVFSAVTVAVALGGLALFPLLAVRSLAYAGVTTALLAAAVSLTVLPALLAVFGARVGAGRGPVRADGEGFWHRLVSFVMRRPVPIATVVTAVLLLLGTPFLGIKLGFPDERVMPASSSARQVATAVRSEFGSAEQDALQVVVARPAGDRTALASYAARLSRLPNVVRVDTVTGGYARGAQVSPGRPGFAAGGSVYLSVVPGSGDAGRLVRDVRAVPAPFGVMVGGTAAVNVDATAALRERLPYAVGAVALVMVVLLFLLTGSLVLPLLALVLSALSLTATFGALVWIFQDGHLNGLLGGFTVTGDIAATIPVMLFALAFGLAMDYQVFLLSRIREEYERGGSATAAVAVGLERIGRIVTAAAVLISLVFLAFTASGITYMKAFGVGLPLAVLMDATLVRGALLPAAMRLGGRATWWAPGSLRRLHARFGLREEAEEPVPRIPVSAE
ncbi:MMPL family transporter [Actinoallomurus sp. CA-150999]|uniref:MMPL family transporter n=1 Tax=Actinoallomurus sp. CA-150999 TaxID=3239887 RepID=UPI003D8F6B82